MRIPGAEKAIDNLVKWSSNEEWAPILEQVFAEHFDPVCDQFDMTGEEIADLLGEAFGMALGTVLEDFFTAQFGDDGEKNVIDDYLKRRGWREKVPARRYLEALRDSVLSLYEVIDLDPGHSMTVRDLVLGGDPITVDEKLGSESAARWDRIAGRIVTVNKRVYFSGTLLLFPHEAAEELLDAIEDMSKRFKRTLRREAKKRRETAEFPDDAVRATILYSGARLFTQTWMINALERITGPLPEIRNTDGEELMFSEARYPITGEVAKVVASLDAVAVLDRDEPDEWAWTWFDYDPDSERASPEGEPPVDAEDDEFGLTVLGRVEVGDDALVLTTNSRERAERGRELLLSRLDKLVGMPLVSYQSLEKMLKDPVDAPPPPRELPDEVAERALHGYLDSHYRKTLDEPIPYLDGKTPRQAARTKKGREQVVQWLKKLENTEARRAASQGQQPYDFGWMWQEMKIDLPG